MNPKYLVHQHKEIGQKIEELEEQKQILKKSIMDGMEGKSLKLDHYTERRRDRISRYRNLKSPTACLTREL